MGEVLQQRGLADAPLPDDGGGLVRRGEQAVRDLTDFRLSSVEAGGVFDGVAEGEGIHPCSCDSNSCICYGVAPSAQRKPIK